jgi:hypothetical protein
LRGVSKDEAAGCAIGGLMVRDGAARLLTMRDGDGAVPSPTPPFIPPTAIIRTRPSPATLPYRAKMTRGAPSLPLWRRRNRPCSLSH